jgi:hypothetical protein
MQFIHYFIAKSDSSTKWCQRQVRDWENRVHGPSTVSNTHHYLFITKAMINDVQISSNKILMVHLCEFLSQLIPMNHPTNAHISLLLFDPFQAAPKVIWLSILPLLVMDFNDVGIMLIYKADGKFCEFSLLHFHYRQSDQFSHIVYYSFHFRWWQGTRTLLKNAVDCWCLVTVGRS